MAKESKSAAELTDMIIAGLQAGGVPALSLEVYGVSDRAAPEMTWTIRKLHLEYNPRVKVEAVVKQVLFPLVSQYDLAE